MKTLSELGNWSEWVVVIGAAVGVIFGFARWVLPLVKRVLQDLHSIRDVLVGRDPIRDNITGKELEPALPGIGVRIATQEEQMMRLTELVGQIAASHQRIDGIDSRVKALEIAAVERIVARQESASAWQAIDSAVRATPDAEATED